MLRRLKPAYIGLIVAFAYFLWKIILFILNAQHGVVERFPVAPLLLLLFGAVIYVEMRELDKARKGEIPGFDMFGAFKTGAQLALVNAVVATGLVYIYYRFIDPDFMEIIRIARMQEAQEQFASGAIGQEQLDNAMNTIEFMFTPNTWAMFTLSGLTIIGFIYAIIIAGLIRYLLVKR